MGYRDRMVKKLKAFFKQAWVRNIVFRALKTFWQGAAAYLALSLPGLDVTNRSVVKALAVGAVAAGLSATFNTINAVK